jgi:hypothetical protein
MYHVKCFTQNAPDSLAEDEWEKVNIDKGTSLFIAS